MYSKGKNKNNKTSEKLNINKNDNFTKDLIFNDKGKIIKYIPKISTIFNEFILFQYIFKVV